MPIHIRFLPQLLSTLKNQIFYTFSHRIARLKCFIFLNSHQCVSCHKFSVFWTILKFLRKKYSLLTFPFAGKWYRSGSGKMMRIWPDPDMKHWLRPEDYVWSATEQRTKQVPGSSGNITPSPNILLLESSIADPWHVGVDPDPDPRIHVSD
jgi:hypothetical protein